MAGTRAKLLVEDRPRQRIAEHVVRSLHAQELFVRARTRVAIRMRAKSGTAIRTPNLSVRRGPSDPKDVIRVVGQRSSQL